MGSTREQAALAEIINVILVENLLQLSNQGTTAYKIQLKKKMKI